MKILTQPKLVLSAIAVGLLLTGAYPKVAWWFLAWLALVPFVLALGKLKPGHAFQFGVLAGLCHYLSLLYWLVPTMSIYGKLPIWLSVIILILFCGFLALYFGAVAGALSHLGKTPLRAAIWFPVIWVAAEYTRAFLFSGFPWGLLAHSQYARVTLIQLADLTGAYGLSFLIAGVNFAIFLILAAATGRLWQGSKVGWRQAIGTSLVLIVLLGAVSFYGTIRLRKIDGLIESATHTTVAAVQGNISQSDKWDDAYKHKTIEIYNRLSADISARKPALIVWPETAAPFFFMVEEKPTRQVLAGIRKSGSHFLIGSPSVKKRGSGYELHNSAWLMDPAANLRARYDKAHLVPFGEFTPFKEWLPFLGKLVEQVGDFTPGTKGRVIEFNDTKLGVQICYEIIFPHLARAQVRNGADLLVNITNDAWYGRTSGPYQHYSMVVFRAVENRRALVRAANTGISGFVDPAGRIVSSTGLFIEAAVMDRLPLLKIQTVYTRTGDLLAKACLFATLAGIIGTWLVSRKKADQQ